MRNLIWSVMLLFIGMSAFSQTKTIEKGSYLSTDKGQRIKLNLLDNNKYELILYSGDYEIKGDSLLFIQNGKDRNIFNLSFVNNNKAKKVKVKFIDPAYFPFYIGTQKGSDLVQYQSVIDIKTKIDPNWIKADLEFEIDKADFLYLVYEGYEGSSNVYKYALPKEVSEITVKYELPVLGDLKLSGFFDQKIGGLKISEKEGKNPLTFFNEKNAQPEKSQKVVPLESELVSNWTYPGKQEALAESAVAADSVAELSSLDSIVGVNKVDFKLKIENNLKNALAATKQVKDKFLVVVVNGKASAKTDFDTFIKDQETQIGYNMYSEYNPQYDVYNFYLAGVEDKKWLKNNKIVNDPAVLVLNGNGEILAQAKSDLLGKEYQLGYYNDFYRQLKRADAFMSFDKVLKNKKATDADLISAFNKVSALEVSYDYETIDASDPSSTDFAVTKSVLDRKEIEKVWKKLIAAHQKDTQPNMLLVETIIKEIKDQGFSKQFFKEEKILNDTDFLAIDYLIKHYDAIEKINKETENSTIESENGTKIGNLSAEISFALQQDTYAAQDETDGKASQDRAIAVYKKLIAAGKGGFDCYKNYLNYLSQEAETSGNDAAFLKEFGVYFDTYLSTEKGNAIQRLDDLFATIDYNSDYSYNGWNSFKEYNSNLCNSAAWAVVLKPENADYIKSAINWSEYSLVVTKNNPYYLDTLAQLYYKDGQKQKAIETQTLAVKYLNAAVEAEIAAEIKETLTKMQNGTY
ncbi:hypothetical protein [Flavobacterium sp. 2]|uniref:hypothetical protein n=1 Tax=Flavobacterium sp. 2 TaxID=308053 RepID=UPI000C17E347|nr:hypothetical protein [Flavobacterium sp. 2]PIF69318.1 hypothetical protein CLU99_0021 [Flavobacterium sp. 2]